MQELAELPEKDREQAISRFRLLEPHLSHGQELRSVSDASGVPLRTLQRWIAQYRKSGLVALVRRSRRDRGILRIVSPAMKSTIEGLALESLLFRSAPSTVRFGSSPSRVTSQHRVMGPFMLSCVPCPQIC